ncbi:hypothetical protein EX895_003026 [Sporisorium graminicola]|uniref:Uncharacterized protein n=1 Tax=Sporisorium graminicola TaxID=280036 RepID=A0A4U7KTV0_9BASI|nr:hypothetical protein EX895_003026 [Sporisorium graminicola]TKY87930.1 hypothetical protein EX895_003026 [Sporisorium graminicola]
MSTPSPAKWAFHDPTSTSSYSVTPSSTNSYTISIASGKRTDWWTSAPHSVPESSAHRTSGPLVYQTLHIDPRENWKLSGTVQQAGSERYQQSTLFIRRAPPSGPSSSVEDSEGQTWLKAGIENEGGRKYVGVVATSPYSDWNVSPLPSRSPSSVYLEIEKTGPDVHVYYTLPSSSQEAEERLLLREKKGFAPLGGEEKEEWWIGAMVCGPLSEKTEGRVEGWTFELLPASAGQH